MNELSYIAFDYLAVQPTTFSPFHGGGKYGKIILNELLKRTDRIILFYSKKTKDEDLDSIIQLHPNIILANLDCPREWNRIFSSYTVEILYLPIPFSKLYKRYSSQFPSNLRIIGTIHGLRDMEIVPSLEMFRYKVSLKGFLRNCFDFFLACLPGWAKKIRAKWRKLIELKNYNYFVVSNHTKNAVKKIFPSQEPKVFYSPSVVSNQFEVCSKKEKYFLLVSGNRWEKNNLYVLRVLDEMFSNDELPKDFFVKITGVSSLKFYRFNFKNPEKFHCYGYVREECFQKMYAQAYALIYPSISEGFGYPILEALSVGTPVVASNTTSIPEVAGTAALYFNPFSKEEIRKQILAILGSDVYCSIQQNAHSQYQAVLNRQNKDLLLAVQFILNPDRFSNDCQNEKNV